jgi:hypothetical protein
LKIPARTVEYSLTESALFPFQAEPTQIPDWSEAELKTMGRFLRKGITANLKKRDLVSARIEYAESTALMNISPEDCWDRTPSTYAA